MYTTFKGPELNVLAPTSEVEILKFLSALPSKQSSKDLLPTWLLKKVHVGLELAPFITRLFCRSTAESHVPVLFKNAVVTPLLKKEGLDCDDL